MKNSPSYKLLFGRVIMVSAIALIGFAAPAQAGFEWRGPLEEPVPAQEAPADSMLPPVTSWDGTADVIPEWNDTAAVQPVAEMPSDRGQVPADVSIVPLAPAEVSDVLAGFGADLPLVIALQQVVPPGYQYSFAEGVNLGQPVSWEGGKAWKQVLEDMLAKEGLGFRVKENIVVVGYFPPEAVVVPAAHNMMNAPVTKAPADNSENAPVTIRRQKPSALKKNDNLNADQDPSSWQTTADRTAQQSEYVASSEAVVAASAGDVVASTGQAPVDLTAADQPAAAPSAPAMTTMQEQSVSEKEMAHKPAWNGRQGDTLRDTLKSWSDSAGVELYWSIDYDYRLKKSVALDGAYDQAVAALLNQFADVRPQPYGQLHQGKDGPRVLVVRSYDLTP